MSMKQIKIGQEVILFTLDGIGNPTIIKGNVIGALSKSTAIGKYIYQISTKHNGTIYRLGTELWESLEALKEDLINLMED